MNRKLLSNNCNLIAQSLLKLVIVLTIVACSGYANAQKSSISSGNFSDPAIWSPAGVPSSADQITIDPNHTVTVDINSDVESVVVQTNASLNITGGNKLSITRSVIVNGTVNVDEGDISLTTQGATWSLGAGSTFIWNPSDNTSNGASLFLNGDENFHSTSTLVIKKWYNFSNTPLGSVVSGDFGNVTLTTISNGLIFEWNQNNTFEEHKILGTLTIDQGWVILDKSGKINNTYIGAIELKNINSYLDFHSGDHNGDFTITTNKITNTGGTINGISNGNGNIELTVNNDLYNYGNFCLIYNGGTANKGIGNTKLTVNGLFQQSHGDFRGIFNISGTGAGTAIFNLKNVIYSGGIFMLHYACNSDQGKSTLNIDGNLDINFTNSTDKFRGTGLTSLSGNPNTTKFDMVVTGNMTVKGHTSGEFISSGSTGVENIKIQGTTTFNDSKISFNEGDHDTELYFEKSLQVNSGSVFLSKTEGSLVATIIRNLELNSGTLSIKGDNGTANLSVHGGYTQNDGSLIFHNNVIDPTQNVIYTTLYGSFIMNGGNLIFENNSNTFVNHQLSCNGALFNIGGNASISSAGTLDNPVFGIIYFDHTGDVNYHNKGNNTNIRNVKQIISSNCRLGITEGPMLVASTNYLVKDMVKVFEAGELKLGMNQVISTGEGAYSCIYIDDSGKLSLESENGLYDGTTTAAINSSGNMTYSLHPNSIVSYTGNLPQSITGTGLGTAVNTDHQYGVLEINKNGGVARLSASNVIVRSKLDLSDGELDLNEFNITINSGKQYAVTSLKGYIRSETQNLKTSGKVVWNNIETGDHTIPFGTGAKDLIPFTFNPVSGTGRSFAVSTTACDISNRPLPSGIKNLNVKGKDGGIDKIIDRYYHIDASGVIARVTCSYLPNENTTSDLFATGNFSGMLWKTNNWKDIGGFGTGTRQTTGSVQINNMNEWGYLALVSKAIPLPADVLNFDAELISGSVNLDWRSKSGIDAQLFVVERSSDGINFEYLLEKQPANNLISTEYSDKDYTPYGGESFYRLKQIDSDGTMKFSNTVKIENYGYSMSGIEILSVGPNPFKNNFTLTYNTISEALIDVKLISLNGQLIYQKLEEVTPGINKFEFVNQNKLAPGMYLITISDGKSKASERLFCY